MQFTSTCTDSHRSFDLVLLVAFSLSPDTFLSEDTNASSTSQIDFLANLLGGNKTADQDGEYSENSVYPNFQNGLLTDTTQNIPSAVGYGRRPVTGRITQPILQLDSSHGERYKDPLGQSYIVPFGVALDVIAQTPTMPPAKHKVSE